MVMRKLSRDVVEYLMNAQWCVLFCLGTIDSMKRGGRERSDSSNRLVGDEWSPPRDIRTFVESDDGFRQVLLVIGCFVPGKTWLGSSKIRDQCLPFSSMTIFRFVQSYFFRHGLLSIVE